RACAMSPPSSSDGFSPRTAAPRHDRACCAITMAILGAVAVGCEDISCYESRTCPPSRNFADAGASGDAGGASDGTSDHAGHTVEGGQGDLEAGGEGGAPRPDGGMESGASASFGATGHGGATSREGAPSCPLDGNPRVWPCLVGDDHAIFVAPDGDDAAIGSRSTPVASVAAAVTSALDEDKLLIVCAKSCSEPLTLSDSQGARVYGGVDCDDDWQPVDEPSVFAPKAGPALRLESVEGSLFFSGFEFRAADATEPGESSIAAIVNDVEDVTFDSTVFVAGDGRDGADGQPIPGYEDAAVS